MKKLKYYGYKKVIVQTREMTLGELKLCILRAYMEKGVHPGMTYRV